MTKINHEDARALFREWRTLFGMDGPVKIGMVSQPVERLANAAAYVAALEASRDRLQEEANELVLRQYEVSAQAADIHRLRGALERLVSHGERFSLDKGLIAGRLYDAARVALQSALPSPTALNARERT